MDEQSLADLRVEALKAAVKIYENRSLEDVMRAAQNLYAFLKGD